MKQDDRNKLSIVIPVFNEEDNILRIADKLSQALAEYEEYEILFVDDGSSDFTLKKIKQISRNNDKIYFLSFSRNFGHQNALRAGMDYCTGDAVITMDGDLQHPPELLPQMIEKWREGFDIVYTTRNDNRLSSILKRKTSEWFYKIINKITELNLKPGSADFRLMDRKVVESLKSFNERAVFYRGLIAWVGFKQYELSYVPAVRTAGQSKYSVRKMLRLAIDGVTAFSIFPLRAAAVVGTVLAMFSFLYVLYALYIKLFTLRAISGWVSVMAGVYFLGGIQLIFLGLCGEYIGKVFMEVKRRPNYLIAEAHLPRELD